VLAGAIPERVVHGRNISKADVSLFRIEGRPVAVKDYGRRPFVARQTLGRLMVRRECRVYETLRGAPGLAPFLGRLGPFAFATGWIEAMPLADLPGGAASPEVFDRLDRVIAGLHERGVALSDLHHRDVLVGADGDVHVVDLAAAFVLGERAGTLRRVFFSRLASQDRLAAARMRARFTGGGERAALAALDPSSVRMWEAGRSVKRLWDRLRGRGD
jgi:tRNA A-37 threonylcarbamoyl transferase component Bud32